MILVCHATYVARPMRGIKSKPSGAALCPHDDQLGRPAREATCRMKSACGLKKARLSGPPHQLRQLGEVRRHARGLVAGQAVGRRATPLA